MSQNNYILFKVFYIGENYHGSQRQPNLRTIENQLLNALYKKGYLDDEDFKKQKIHSAGRTDTGVHARGMTYGFYNHREEFHPIEVNTALPEDIIIWSSARSELVDNIPCIHPRYQASQRHYKYCFNDIDRSLDKKIIQDCVSKLCGTHDFRNFAKIEEKTDTKRTIDKIIIENEKDLWIFNFHARSFLRQQIRNMIRVIVQIGSQKWDMEVLNSLFNPKDNSYALKIEPMPPDGLILWDILYPEVKFENCVASYSKLNRILMQWLSALKVRNKILNSLKLSFE